MLSQIPEKLPNVIKDMLESLGIPMKEGEGTGLRDEPQIEKIWLIYNMASKDVKVILDLLLTVICKKSLKNVLEYDEPGESLAAGPSAGKSALGPTLQIMADMVRNRVVDG